ncbi:translation factor [Clavulina sp. PMI_390]|nr:translation factor [Clavulina sp. PMI_390]
MSSPSSHKLHREHSVVTRMLPVDPSSISFVEDPISQNQEPSTSSTSSAIDTCTPHITSQETLDSLNTAARHLSVTREPVAFPTETVYGLGAIVTPDSTAAVKRIYELKGRPSDNPLIVHISSLKMLREQVLPDQGITIPRMYEVLMKAFWPGPLTLLFPAHSPSSTSPTAGDSSSLQHQSSSKIPPVVTANHPTVAVRMPSHPIARALIALTNIPLAAPSANSSGRPSPTKAEHVFKDLNGKVGIILDDGASSQVGLESTVVDGLNVDGHLRVLRPGGVTVEDIRRVLDENGMREDEVKVLVHKRDYRDDEQESAPTTPGMKYRHYSPTVPVVLLVPSTESSSPSNSGDGTADKLHVTESVRAVLDSLISRFEPTQNITLGLLLTSDSALLDPIQSITTQIHPLGARLAPNVTAQRLFDGLLTLDNDGVDLILVESIDEVREGLAVMNRVRKAAGEVRRVDVSGGC